MAIDRVSVRLQSETLTAAKLAEVAGEPPTSAAERGSLVSARQSSGPVHAVTTIIYGAEADGDDDLGSFVAALQPLLGRLADLPTRGDLSADLIVAVTGSPMGFMASLDAAMVRLLSSANCGIVFDVYEAEDADT
jgi:hypothetical protein